MTVLFTTIRIILAVAFLAYGIFNICLSIVGYGDAIAGVNMVLAPLLLIISKYIFPAFFASMDSDLLFSIVLGVFVVGGIVSFIMGLGFILGFLHAIGWFVIAFLVLDLSQLAAPVASILVTITSYLFSPIAIFILAAIFIVAFFCLIN